MNASTRRVRLGAIALAVAAVLFVLYPATRPWHDESTPDGAAVPIEDRDSGEVLRFGGTAIAPAGAAAVNPAFDVTPRDLVTAIVTDRRVIPAGRSAQVGRGGGPRTGQP